MVKFIEVLHVSKDDVLLVDDSWRNFLNSTGHFPQIGLQIEKNKNNPQDEDAETFHREKL